MAKRETNILIIVQEPNLKPYAAEVLGPEDFGGTIPAVGDRIVAEDVEEGEDRFDPTARTVYEVIERYFLPSENGGPRVSLIVTSRDGLSDEGPKMGI